MKMKTTNFFWNESLIIDIEYILIVIESSWFIRSNHFSITGLYVIHIHIIILPTTFLLDITKNKHNDGIRLNRATSYAMYYN